MENSFDRKATTWDDNPRRIKMAEQVEAVLKAQVDFNKNMKLLDYGCGTGLLGFKFIDDVKEVTFCDSSEGMLEQVKKKIAYYEKNNAVVLNADFLKDEINEKYDVITSMLVLHHVAELPKLIGVFNKILNEGGLFCWIDLETEDGSFHNDPTIPHFGFDKDEMTALLVSQGFEPVLYYRKIQLIKETETGTKAFPLFVFVSQKAAHASR
jgi:tRNA (cmo5U34)-methyltransferase